MTLDEACEEIKALTSDRTEQMLIDAEQLKYEGPPVDFKAWKRAAKKLKKTGKITFKPGEWNIK